MYIHRILKKAFYKSIKHFPAVLITGPRQSRLVVQAQGKLWPIEIKLTSTPSVHHIKSLERFKKLAGDEASPLGVIVCRTKDKVDLLQNNIALPWFAFFEWLEDIISS